jgi:hypothetical protein
MSDTATRANAWIAGRDTGASSKALWAVMMGVKSDGSYPSDGGDLGRCLRLLEAVPEWKPRLKEMAAVNGYWAALVAHWDELAALHAKDDERGRHDAVYARMKQILDPIEAKDPRIFKMGNGASIRFGRP